MLEAAGQQPVPVDLDGCAVDVLPAADRVVRTGQGLVRAGGRTGSPRRRRRGCAPCPRAARPPGCRRRRPGGRRRRPGSRRRRPRGPVPTWFAARPTPEAASMVANMSRTRVRSSSSNRLDGAGRRVHHRGAPAGDRQHPAVGREVVVHGGQVSALLAASTAARGRMHRAAATQAGRATGNRWIRSPPRGPTRRVRARPATATRSSTTTSSDPWFATQTSPSATTRSRGCRPPLEVSATKRDRAPGPVQREHAPPCRSRGWRRRPRGPPPGAPDGRTGAARTSALRQRRTPGRRHDVWVWRPALVRTRGRARARPDSSPTTTRVSSATTRWRGPKPGGSSSGPERPRTAVRRRAAAAGAPGPCRGRTDEELAGAVRVEDDLVGVRASPDGPGSGPSGAVEVNRSSGPREPTRRSSSAKLSTVPLP